MSEKPKPDPKPTSVVLGGHPCLAAIPRPKEPKPEPEPEPPSHFSGGGGHFV